MIKIYPTLIIKGTPLYDLWKQGRYDPLTTEQASCLIATVKMNVPEWVRIQRIQRDIPAQEICTGIKKSNLRQYVEVEMQKNHTSCRCFYPVSRNWACLRLKKQRSSRSILCTVCIVGTRQAVEMNILSPWKTPRRMSWLGIYDYEISSPPTGMSCRLSPLPIAARWGGRLVAAMNGQCWMIGRGDYLAHEPHRTQPDEVLEDVRIGRFLASRGVRPRFADLQDDIDVWMYRDGREAWQGFRKNAYLLFGGRPLPFTLLFGLFALTFVVAPLSSPLWLAWAMGTKLIADQFSRFPLWVSAAAPVTFGLWTVLLLDSAVSHLRGRVEWKGRRVANGQVGPAA